MKRLYLFVLVMIFFTKFYASSDQDVKINYNQLADYVNRSLKDFSESEIAAEQRIQGKKVLADLVISGMLDNCHNKSKDCLDCQQLKDLQFRHHTRLKCCLSILSLQEIMVNNYVDRVSKLLIAKSQL